MTEIFKTHTKLIGSYILFINYSGFYPSYNGSDNLALREIHPASLCSGKVSPNNLQGIVNALE